MAAGFNVIITGVVSESGRPTAYPWDSRMKPIQWNEIIFAALSFFLLIVYHAHWIFQVRRSPLKTYMGVTKRLRLMWVETIMRERRDILAVQTLRNWTMASSFLASTAILIGLGLLSLWFRPEYTHELPFEFSQVFTRLRTLFAVKLMLLIVDFFFAFYSFCLSIRYLNHINFMINVPLECDPAISVDYVAHTLDRGIMHYTLGMRAYYLAVIFTLWLFGPQWMLLGTVVVLVFLYNLDHCCPVESSSHCDFMTIQMARPRGAGRPPADPAGQAGEGDRP